MNRQTQQPDLRAPTAEERVSATLRSLARLLGRLEAQELLQATEPTRPSTYITKDNFDER